MTKIRLIILRSWHNRKAIEPFEEYQPFIKLMDTLGDNTLLGARVGALFTILVKSSFARVAIIVTSVSQGLISLSAGIALMLVGKLVHVLIHSLRRLDAIAQQCELVCLIFNRPMSKSHTLYGRSR